MTSKKLSWPKNNDTLNFEDLVEKIRDCIDFAYILERKNENISIPYSGPRAPKNEKQYKIQLSAKDLDYSEIEQGRDPIDVIIGIAISLGIEQGKRLCTKNHFTIECESIVKYKDKIIESLLKDIKEKGYNNIFDELKEKWEKKL